MLINVTLETLLRFLNWIPLGYIFETELIHHLITTFFVIPAFRNVTLKCLTEIGKDIIFLLNIFLFYFELLFCFKVSINVGTYQDKFILLFNLTMTTLKQVIFKNTNLIN